MVHTVKLMDFGEDGVATEAEIASRRALFKTEVAVWKELDHPNVTQVISSAPSYLHRESICVMYSSMQISSYVVSSVPAIVPSLAMLLVQYRQLYAHCESVLISFLQFVGASMGTIDLKIPVDGGESGNLADLPLGACCLVVEYLDGGSLKTHLIKHMKNKLAYKAVVQLALDLARGYASLLNSVKQIFLF